MEVPCYKQEKEYSCAVCCLRMMLEFYGGEYEEEELEKLCKTTEKGTIAKNVVDVAKRTGFLALLCEGDFVAAWNDLSNLLIMIKPQKE